MIHSTPRRDAELTEQLVRQHARTFAAASWFLPPEKRRAAFAVYAFCRVADDFVDEAVRGSAEAEMELAAHRAALVAMGQTDAETPLFRELQWAMQRFDIPVAPFHALLDMLCTDLAPVEYHTWSELELYCGGVASTVGEMCAHVFGMPASAAARDEALRRARVLGVGLQLTNILRDVGEDAARGRCYLPVEDLQQFGIARDEILGGAIRGNEHRWRELMRFEIARARALYAESEPGLRSLDHDARCCATICSTGYAGILNAIERRDYDTLTGRAHIGTARKLVVMMNAWRTTRTRRDAVTPDALQSPNDHPIRA